MADELSAESSAAIEAAVRVLSTSGPDLITAPAYADPTLDAMSVLAAELKSPLLPSNPAVEHRGDPVRDHATASGWLGWQVRLTGTWVDRVALPTLLTRRGKPAALLPRAGKPVLVDGSSRTTRPWTVQRPPMSIPTPGSSLRTPRQPADGLRSSGGPFVVRAVTLWGS